MIKNYAITNRKLLGNNILIQWAKLFIICIFLARNLLIKLVLFLLSYIVPKSKKVLFFSSVGNYNFPIWCNEQNFQFKESPKYLAIYSAKKLKKFVTIFHVPNKRLFDKIKKLNIKPTKGLTAFWYMLRARYLFVDNNNFFNPNASFLIGNFKIIQCWHGTPLKNMEQGRENKSDWFEKIKNIEKTKFHRVVTTCGYSTEVYKRLFNTERILETGYPRNDIFYNPDFFSCEDIKQKFGLSDYKKVLLYAPTFRKLEKVVNPFDTTFFEKLNESLKNNSYLLLIKQHPYSNQIGGLEEFSNISDVSGLSHDLQELLVYTDVLISDYSSSIFDFSLTGKLQLFYPFDIKEYEKNRGGLYFEYDEQYLPGLIIKDNNDFLRKIGQLEILIENESIKAKIKVFKNKFNRYTDADSCKRIFQHLKLDEKEI